MLSIINKGYLVENASSSIKFALLSTLFVFCNKGYYILLALHVKKKKKRFRWLYYTKMMMVMMMIMMIMIKLVIRTMN